MHVYRWPVAVLFYVAHASYVNAAANDGKFCYVCNSNNDFGCFQPSYDTRSEKCRYGCVLKINTLKDGNTEVLRSCGAWQSLYQSNCTQTRSIDGVTVTECMCKTDYCNKAAMTPANELQLDRCYRCQYYGSKSAEHVTNTACLYPDSSTPTVLCPYGYCRKIYFKSGDYTGVSRMCVDVTSVSLSCIPDSAGDVQYETCNCQGDLCNSALSLSVDVVSVLLGSAIFTWSAVKSP